MVERWLNLDKMVRLVIGGFRKWSFQLSYLIFFHLSYVIFFHLAYVIFSLVIS